MATHHSKKTPPSRWSREFLPGLELVATTTTPCHSDDARSAEEEPALCWRRQTAGSSSPSLLGMTRILRWSSASDKYGGPCTDRPPPKYSRASLGLSGSKTRTHTNPDPHRPGPTQSSTAPPELALTWRHDYPRLSDSDRPATAVWPLYPRGQVLQFRWRNRALIGREDLWGMLCPCDLGLDSVWFF
jgi:hypothetical protein